MAHGAARLVRLIVTGALLAGGVSTAQLPFPQQLSRTWAKPPSAGATSRTLPTGAVVVRAVPGRARTVEQLVVDAGGRVTRELGIIDGFAASLPPAASRALAARADVVSDTQADDLYELTSERAATGRPMILTSNRAPTDWYPLFPNPVIAESLLDRLINNSHALLVDGPSYRPRTRPRPAGSTQTDPTQ